MGDLQKDEASAKNWLGPPRHPSDGRRLQRIVP
jgi:hypothetical protein